MDWLITTRRDFSLEQLDDLLARLNCERVSDDPIPLGTNEQVVEVTGPKDLPDRLKGDARVLKVSPNSVMDYFQI